MFAFDEVIHLDRGEIDDSAQSESSLKPCLQGFFVFNV